MTSSLAFYNICLIKMARSPRQHALRFRTWGGHRAGAGRKPGGSPAGVPHRPRPIHDHRHPVHVTMRAVRGLPWLRTRRVFRAVRDALALSSHSRFRVVHFTVQTNHLHLLIEADESRAVTRDARARNSAREGDQPPGRTRRPGLVGLLPLPRVTDTPRGAERSDLRAIQWTEASCDRARH